MCHLLTHFNPFHDPPVLTHRWRTAAQIQKPWKNAILASVCTQYNCNAVWVRNFDEYYHMELPILWNCCVTYECKFVKHCRWSKQLFTAPYSTQYCRRASVDWRRVISLTKMPTGSLRALAVLLRIWIGMDQFQTPLMWIGIVSRMFI